MAVSEIGVDELEAALQAGARLVDVREPDEYDEAHVPGAMLVPLATVPDALHHFSSDQTTYVICKSGGRSMRACEFLDDQGHSVVNVAGGTMAWIVSGRATASGDQPA
jgi:rhodanese-related sulfurtransferase